MITVLSVSLGMNRTHIARRMEPSLERAGAPVHGAMSILSVKAVLAHYFSMKLSMIGLNGQWKPATSPHWSRPQP